METSPFFGELILENIFKGGGRSRVPQLPFFLYQSWKNHWIIYNFEDFMKLNTQDTRLDYRSGGGGWHDILDVLDNIRKANFFENLNGKSNILKK